MTTSRLASVNTTDVINKSNCKPRFETPLRSTTVLYIGRRGELLVELHGVPAPTVTWTLNNVSLKESDRIHVEYLSEGWYKLVIDNVNYDDSGVYKVVATNEHGERESETLVHVELGPPIISSLCKSDIKLKKGEKLCIVVSIKDYGDDYYVKWFKNLQPIPSGDDKVKITKKRHMSSLKIDSVELHETGQYKCVVSSVGETSMKFNVEVKDTKETNGEEEESDIYCHGNNVILNKSLCNKSSSLNDLLESSTLQADIRKTSLDDSANIRASGHNLKKQDVKEGRTKDSNCPDIYASLTPSSKRNALRSKNLFSCVRLKAFFRDSLHFKKHKSDRTLYKSKSISHFPDRGNKENRIEDVENMAPHTDENIMVTDTSLQLRSASLPDLIDENNANEKNQKTGLQSPVGVRAKSRRTRSLVSSMKHSISRKFGRRKSFVEPEDKHTPPKLVKFSKKYNNCDSERKEINNSCRNEGEFRLDELIINDLTHEDKETMEQKLHVLIFGSLKWQLLTSRLCEKGLIDIEQEEIEICKYPYRLNIGRKLIENILRCKPDISIDEFIRIAKNRNREDICLLLRTFDCLRLHDVSAVERQKLEILCSYQTTFSGYTWKLLAQDFELSEECINSIEETLYSPTPPYSSFEELLNIFRTRNPLMTLKCIVGTLRELHFDESADTLENIISEKENNP